MKYFKYVSLLLFLLTTFVSSSVYAVQSAIDYANENCDGNSYAKSVVFTADDLWTEVRKYIDSNGEKFNPDYWITMTTQAESNNPYPWNSAKGNKGVLFILPQDVSYSGMQNLDYYVAPDEDGKRFAPRIGFCGYDINIIKNNAVLKLTGKQSIEPDPKHDVSPLRVTGVQIDLYGIDIDADDVDQNYTAIKLEGIAKLILNRVNFHRNNNTLLNNSIGLVGNISSYLSLKHSVLTQKSNAGAMFYNEHSKTVCEEQSVVNVSGNVYPFVGISSELDSKVCHYHSLAKSESTVKPIFFYDFYGEEVDVDVDEVIPAYRFCLNSKDPAHEYPPRPYNDEPCSVVFKRFQEDANYTRLNDNLFSGYWQKIFRPSWSSFPLVNINKFAVDANNNKLGGVEECAAKNSFSIDNDVNFDGKLCIEKMQW